MVIYSWYASKQIASILIKQEKKKKQLIFKKSFQKIKIQQFMKYLIMQNF